MVTVWTGVQRDAVAEMARYDMLRLLASEIGKRTFPRPCCANWGEPLDRAGARAAQRP